MWHEESGGTQSTTGGGSEDTLATLTETGDYRLGCDLNDLVNGDTGEIRIYVKTRPGGTSRVVYRQQFAHIQADPNWQSPVVSVPVGGEIKASIVQVAGTASVPWSLYRDVQGVVRQNTCQTDGSADSTHAVLDAGASALDDYYNGMWWKPVAGTAVDEQPRAITDYVGSTKRVTLDPPLGTNADNTTEFAIFV